MPHAFDRCKVLTWYERQQLGYYKLCGMLKQAEKRYQELRDQIPLFEEEGYSWRDDFCRTRRKIEGLKIALKTLREKLRKEGAMSTEFRNAAARDGS
jgi:hypothetical protein